MKAMKASPYNITLPMGQFSFSNDGSALAKIRTSIRNKDKTIEAVNSLSGLDSYRFWLCNNTVWDSDELNLFYSKSALEIVSLRDLMPQWRREPALNLGRAISMADYILRAIGELESLRPFHFFLSPGQVFSISDEIRKERWIVLPLPIDDAVIGDFLRADEECWGWLSADELLGVVYDDRAYTAGMVLYLSLIGEVFPKEIARAERIRRVLSYRVGNPALAQNVLRNAMPKAHQKTAEQLCDFIMALLRPSLGRPLTMVQISHQLDYFHAELSPYRLACEWEKENDISRALKCLEDFIPTVADKEVPWDMVERLRRKIGDEAGADSAAKKANKPISLISRLHELAAAADKKPELEQLVSSTIKEFASQPEQLTEEEYLYLAYVNGRWLGRFDETIQWLEHDFSVSWFKVVCCMLKSRLFANKADWIEVIRNCRNGQYQIAKMPNTGGRLGRYGDAYFDLLNGIANVCEVHEQNYSQEFLKDAFRHFNRAWINQQMAGAQDLNGAIISWLRWLDKFSENNPNLETQRLEIEALLRALDPGTARKDCTEKPDIPWFSETDIFNVV
jgi:hypothetical protein